MAMTDPKVIIALDHETDHQALEFIEKLDPATCHVKIGSILFTHYGPLLVEKIIARGFRLFLDLKFHDIPQTVAGACREAVKLGVWMVNVHASGGFEMMKAAREAIDFFPSDQRPILLGVTVLTSLNDEDLSAIGYANPVKQTVLHLAQLAHSAGLDGLVCSGMEVQLIRQHLPKEFLLVTPGIRLAEDSPEDQKRLMTPQAAIAAGANYLVIGRSITRSPNPQTILDKLTNTTSL